MSEPTAIYRLFDAEGELLYVGVTTNPSRRFSQHKAKKSWWPEVARKDILWMDTYHAAVMAEEDAIYRENPAKNISRPRPVWLVRQEAERKRLNPSKHGRRVTKG